MTSAIALRQEPTALALEPTSLPEAIQLATLIKKASLCPGYLKTPEDVLLVIMRGRELGLTAMQSVAGMYVINGKVGMYADLIVGICKRHKDCEYFRLISTDDKQSTYETKRRGEEPTRMSYTIEQAKTAELTGNQNYKKHPAAMLRARCSAALGRAVYPDSLLGIYERDELEEIERNHAPPQKVETTIVDGPDLSGKLAESIDDAQAGVFEDLMVALLESRSLEQLEGAAAKVSDAVKAEKIGPQHRETLLKAYKEMKAKVA